MTTLATAASLADLRGLTEPRIFTPPLRELTPDSSLGFDVIDFAENVLEVYLLPWQKWLLIHMFELTPSGSLRYRTVVVLVARQNGKSTLSVVISLYFMAILRRRLILGTAQDLETAEEIWQQAVDLVEENELLSDMKKAVVRGNGKRALVFKTGERYKVRAANRRAARGLSGDLVMMDELREQTNWDAWGAITKTTMARAFALVLALSNAGDAASVVLHHLRKMAHLALGDPDGINKADRLHVDEEPDEELAGFMQEVNDAASLGLFEWSAAPGCSKFDPAGWVQANPSLGHLEGFTFRNLAAAASTDPEWVFRTECLCQWPDSVISGEFWPGSWETSSDPLSARAEGARVVYGLDVEADRSRSSISIATFREDGLRHIEVVASRAGTEWVKGWFLDDTHPERRTRPIVGQDTHGAPSATVLEDLRSVKNEWGEQALNVVKWQGVDLSVGWGELYDGIRGARNADGALVPLVYHRPAPILDLAAGFGKARQLADGGKVWDRRGSTVNMSGLISANAAHWGLLHASEAEQESAYERHGLEMV